MTLQHCLPNAYSSVTTRTRTGPTAPGGGKPRAHPHPISPSHRVRGERRGTQPAPAVRCGGVRAISNGHCRNGGNRQSSSTPPPSEAGHRRDRSSPHGIGGYRARGRWHRQHRHRSLRRHRGRHADRGRGQGSWLSIVSCNGRCWKREDDLDPNDNFVRVNGARHGDGRAVHLLIKKQLHPNPRETAHEGRGRPRAPTAK